MMIFGVIVYVFIGTIMGDVVAREAKVTRNFAIPFCIILWPVILAAKVLYAVFNLSF
jgi:hypothetical protein